MLLPPFPLRKSFSELLNPKIPRNPKQQHPQQPSNPLLVQAYTTYFSDVEAPVSEGMSTLSLQSQIEGITVLPPQYDGTLEIKVKSCSMGGALTTYTLRLGRFRMEVTLLHSKHNAHKTASPVLAKSTSGVILDASTRQHQLVTKRVYFRKGSTPRANYHELRAVIVEYGFCRICSALGIGPKMLLQSGFDIICFEDCADFDMERCRGVFDSPQTQQIAERRLKYCIRLLHSLKFIHKDVKPQNIMWSDTTQQLVLIDFGISCVVREPQGLKSLTFREGTPKFMCEEMLELREDEGYVDLYWQDAYSLKVTVECIPNNNERVKVGISHICEIALEKKAIQIVYEAYIGQPTNENEDRQGRNFAQQLFGQYFSALAATQTLRQFISIPLLLRTYGDSPALLQYLSTAILHTNTPNYQQLLEKAIHKQNICELLKASEIVPRHGLRHLLLECADLYFNNSHLQESIDCLKQARIYASKSQLLYDWFLPVLNGDKITSTKQLSDVAAVEFVMQAALLNYELKRYQHTLHYLGVLLNEPVDDREQGWSLRGQILSTSLLLMECPRITTVGWCGLAHLILTELYARGEYVNVGERAALYLSRPALTNKQRGIFLWFKATSEYQENLFKTAATNLQEALLYFKDDPSLMKRLQLSLAAIVAKAGETDNALAINRQLSITEPFLHQECQYQTAWCLFSSSLDNNEFHRKYGGKIQPPSQVGVSKAEYLQLLSSYLQVEQLLLMNVPTIYNHENMRFPISTMELIGIDGTEDMTLLLLKVGCSVVIAYSSWESKRQGESVYAGVFSTLLALLDHTQRLRYPNSTTFPEITEASLERFLANPVDDESLKGVFQTSTPQVCGMALLCMLMLMTYKKMFGQISMLLTLKWVEQGFSAIKHRSWNKTIVSWVIKQLKPLHIDSAVRLSELRLVPELVECYELGKILFEAKQFARCVNTLLEIRQLKAPANLFVLAQAECVLGNAYMEVNNKQLADDSYSRAVAVYRSFIKQQCSPLCCLLAEYLMRLEEYRQAQQAYSKSILYMIRQKKDLRRPFVGKVMESAGVCHFQLGDYKRARSYFMHAICTGLQLNNRLNAMLHLAKVSYFLQQKRLFWRQARQLVKKNKKGWFVQRLRQFLEKKKDSLALDILFGKKLGKQPITDSNKTSKQQKRRRFMQELITEKIRKRHKIV